MAENLLLLCLFYAYACFFHNLENLLVPLRYNVNHLYTVDMIVKIYLQNFCDLPNIWSVVAWFAICYTP